MSNKSSVEAATRPRAEERAITHEALAALSPGTEDGDEKNQDRLALSEGGAGAACQFAIICDGTSTSPFSAEAAERVSRQVDALFEEGGLRQVVEALREMRSELISKPVKLDEDYSELLRGMLEEIVREKYRISYQTTFVAVRLSRDENDDAAGKVSVKALGCGDSALFIFREGGELIFNNVNLGDEFDDFKHGSPLTPVLPDSYDEEESRHVLVSDKYPQDVHLLLCSDGFYDGFTNFKEVHEWLNEHRAELSTEGAAARCLAELHRNLEQKKGDDDISFIWLRPLASPPEKALGKDEKPEDVRGDEESDAGEFPEVRRVGGRGLFAAFRDFIRRFLWPDPPPGRGGN
ncbi:MAG: PP2C family serine/threonine-protein phosphatase [Pyrinomonadaceae bacterium]